MHDQSNSWSIQLINSFSSNWFTLLLLCTSAPLVFVLWSVRSWFKTGKAWTGGPGKGSEDYEVSLCQQVGIHNYYAKDHIITCDRCTSGKFYSFVCWITWWGRMKTSHLIWNHWYMYFMVLWWYFILWNTLEYIKLIILPAFLEGAVFVKRRKMNKGIILSNCMWLGSCRWQPTTCLRWKNGKHVVYFLNIINLVSFQAWCLWLVSKRQNVYMKFEFILLRTVI